MKSSSLAHLIYNGNLNYLVLLSPEYRDTPNFDQIEMTCV